MRDPFAGSRSSVSRLGAELAKLVLRGPASLPHIFAKARALIAIAAPGQVGPDVHIRHALFGQAGIVVVLERVRIVVPIRRFGPVSIVPEALAAEHHPGQPNPDQRQRDRVLGDRIAKVAGELHAAAFAEVADCLVEQLARRQPSLDRIEGVLDFRSRLLNLALDFGRRLRAGIRAACLCVHRTCSFATWASRLRESTVRVGARWLAFMSLVPLWTKM
jgi:hypothetical protein